MLAIRLHRQGKTNQPFYKIVVTEKQKSSTRGRFVEQVGFYNPLTKERKIEGERVKHWISVGAKPTDTVHNMLVSEKIIESPKIPKHKKKKVTEEKAESAAASVQATEKSAPAPTNEIPVEEKSAPEDKPVDAPTPEPTEEQPTIEPDSTDTDEPAAEEPKEGKVSAPTPPIADSTDKPVENEEKQTESETKENKESQ